MGSNTLQVKDFPITDGSKLTDHIVVSTAGVAVQGPDIDTPNGVWIKALKANTGIGVVGNDGADDVTTSNGYELSAGESDLWPVTNLNQLYFDVAVSSEGFCWHLA